MPRPKRTEPVVRPGINRWMSENTGKVGDSNALEFVEKWLAMRVAGTTDWSGHRVHEYLHFTYNFPFSSEAMFLRWVKRTYPDQYARGVARGRQ